MGLFVGVSNPLEVSLLTGAIGASGVLSIWSVGDLASFDERPFVAFVLTGASGNVQVVSATTVSITHSGITGHLFHVDLIFCNFASPFLVNTYNPSASHFPASINL